MAVFSRPVDRGYIVKGEQAKKYLEQKPDKKILEMHRQRASLILHPEKNDAHK